ncbi:MAG: hypothetical protein J5812_04460 [Candidatus Methanomethylophilaceae archaeon]|jgi:chromosome segregation ATPase|nr:hypothetical protein [Candidatus Methanomethylophilaceae archaeon]
MSKEVEDMTEELEKPAEEPMEISKEDAETFKLVIEDLKKNMEEFRKKTEAMQASPPSAKGSFRNKQTAIGKPSPDLEAKVASLKERVEDIESKNEKLRKKNGELGNDLARAKTRLDDLMEEVESLTKENAALRKRNKELVDMPKASEEAKERCTQLESENAIIRAELEKIRMERSALEYRFQESEAIAAETIAEKDSRIKEQDEIIRKLKSGIPLSEIAGTVERISATQFESSLFEAGRYDVRMARNGSYVTFKPDVQGKVACVDGTLSIPSLEDLVKFDEPRKYDAYHFNGGLKVVLR